MICGQHCKNPLDESASLRAENERLSNRLADLVQLGSRSNDKSQLQEIARLRAKVAQLRRDAELAKNAASSSAPHIAANALIPASAQISIRTEFISVPANGSDVGGASGLVNWNEGETIKSSFKAQAEANGFSNGPQRDNAKAEDRRRSAPVRAVASAEGGTNIGVMVDFIPECSLDSDVISLTTLVRATRLGEQSNVEELVFTNSINITSGNSLMMTRRLPGMGAWFDGDPTNSSGPRDLIVFISPTL